jgi:ribonuclease HI
MTIYTDGSCLNNGKISAKAGTGIWISENNPLNKALKIPGPHQTNQVGEIAAVVAALQMAPTYAP